MKRSQLTGLLINLLAGILTGEGYNTDLGSNVFDGKTQVWVDEEMPGIAVKELDSSVVQVMNGAWDWKTRFMLQCRDKAVTQESCRLMAADVIAAILNDRDLEGEAIRIVYAGDEIIAVQADDEVGGVDVTLEIDYRTLEWES